MEKYIDAQVIAENGEICAKWTLEIKSRIVMAKQAFNKKKVLLTSKFDFNLRKKLVRCTTLYGAETWTLWKVDQKYLESF
jgi:hypothetical protein